MWIYPRDEEMSNTNLIPFIEDNPVTWGINYQPTNKFSYHHGDVEARTIHNIQITRNGEVFYKFLGNSDYGIAKAKVLIERFKDHPLDLNFIDFDKKMIGRKVWWKGQPGIITRYIKEQACVIIEPDHDIISKFGIPMEYDNDEDRYLWEDFENDVKVEIFSESVYWFRD